jgi:acyl-CoA reductase-like NAD-dependent aldehyde dehydrogenase
MNQSSISSLILNQKKFFNSGTAKDISFRIKQLINLKKAIMENEEEILDACKFDMKKPLLETYVSERGMVLNEIDYAVKHLNSWAKPRTWGKEPMYCRS